MKRRSATRNEPPEPTFFTDRDLGKKLPDLLRSSGLKVESFHDHFDQATPDVEWLTVVGKNGWVALTHDKNIRYRSVETEALMMAGARTFVFIGTLPYPRFADAFLQVQAQVRRILKRQNGPFIAKVYVARNTISMWLTYEEWSRRRGKE